MTSIWLKSDDETNSTGDFSSTTKQLSNISPTVQQHIQNSESPKQTLIEECASLKNQCNELITQKQAIEIRTDMLLAEIEEKDNELKHLREITNTINLSDNQLKDENTHLKKRLESQEQTEKEFNEKIHTLQSRIKELEDWNGDYQENDSPKTIEIQNKEHSNLQSNIDSLASRNRQLETDLQRLQSQQRNNQLALERLDEYEETISQLHEELDQLRSNKKNKSQISNDEDANRLLMEERKQMEIERNERENLQIQIGKELNIREMLERQLIELNEDMQSLENDKHQLNNQLDELRQQLQSRDRQIQTYQSSAITPGSPPTITLSSEQQIRQLNSIYDQFVILLPREFSSSDNIHLSLTDRYADLIEQFSSYIGTFSIIQEELDSLKQILNEKQDELEKLRLHLDKLTQLQEEQALIDKNKSYESDEDELEEILGFQQRAPSRQSLLSTTPGEKQQLIAQNELLSSLLTEKEQELISLQQAEKTREDLMKNFEVLKSNLQQMEFDKEVKQIELNDIRNVLDEKLRENSSLKKEKMFFIEKISEYERERQEQQSMIQMSPRQSSQSPTVVTNKASEQNSEQTITQDQYEKLRSDYDQLLELAQRQHDESLSYYNEYTRILTLHNDLNTKYSQLQIDYESVQTLIEQKNQAYLQCQNELNTYQNLLYHQKKKSDDIDLLRSSLNEREIKLQELITNEQQFLLKQSELERDVKLLEENNFKLKFNQQLFEQIQLDLKHATHERDLAIVEKKQLENQIEFNREKLLQIQEREQYINNQLLQHQNSLHEQISITARLTNENNEVLSSIFHLNEQIQFKDLFINQLQKEIDNFQAINNTRVEKQLVKNILLSYFHTPIDKQQEVIPLISALVGFTQEECQKAMNAISNNNNNNANSSWLTGWLGANPSRTKTQFETTAHHPDKSFAELLIQYIDQQSPIINLNPDNSTHHSVDSTASNVEQDLNPILPT